MALVGAPETGLNVKPVSGWRPVAGSARRPALIVSDVTPAGSGLRACSVSTRATVVPLLFL